MLIDYSISGAIHNWRHTLFHQKEKIKAELNGMEYYWESWKTIECISLISAVEKTTVKQVCVDNRHVNIADWSAWYILYQL